MKRTEYFKKVQDLYDAGKVDDYTYDAMIENADCFCEDDDEYRSNIPETYAEIEYTEEDFERDGEAYDGCRFDDMNYLRMRER